MRENGKFRENSFRLVFDKRGLHPFLQIGKSPGRFIQAPLLEEFKPGADQLVVSFASENIAMASGLFSSRVLEIFLFPASPANSRGNILVGPGCPGSWKRTICSQSSSTADISEEIFEEGGFSSPCRGSTSCRQAKMMGMASIWKIPLLSALQRSI